MNKITIDYCREHYKESPCYDSLTNKIYGYNFWIYSHKNKKKPERIIIARFNADGNLVYTHPNYFNEVQ